MSCHKSARSWPKNVMVYMMGSSIFVNTKLSDLTSFGSPVWDPMCIEKQGVKQTHTHAHTHSHVSTASQSYFGHNHCLTLTLKQHFTLKCNDLHHGVLHFVPPRHEAAHPHGHIHTYTMKTMQNLPVEREQSLASTQGNKQHAAFTEWVP